MYISEMCAQDISGSMLENDTVPMQHGQRKYRDRDNILTDKKKDTKYFTI